MVTGDLNKKVREDRSIDMLADRQTHTDRQTGCNTPLPTVAE